ncbi:hypothetical protein AHAS_Ahas15G0146200 [Arachis hypogaea]
MLLEKILFLVIVRHFIKNHKYSTQDVLKNTHSFISNLVSLIINNKLKLTFNRLPNDIRNDIFKDCRFSLIYHHWAWNAK